MYLIFSTWMHLVEQMKTEGFIRGQSSFEVHRSGRLTPFSARYLKNGNLKLVYVVISGI